MAQAVTIPANDLKRPFELHADAYEQKALEVLRSGWYILGKEVSAFEQAFAAYLGARCCVGLASGLDSLWMAFRLLGIGPGDEVIVCANAYIACVMGITINGATPVFVEPDEYDNIDAAIVASGTCGDGIVEHDLFSDRFYAYVSPENPLFERTNIRIEDIDLKDLILLSRGNCMRDQIIELCQARRSVPSHYYFESGSLDTLMRIVDCTACLTIIPEMALEYIPAERRAQVKTLAKGATSRRIAIVVRRTYVKNSIISALESTIMAKAAPKAAAKSPVPATTQPQTA